MSLLVEKVLQNGLELVKLENSETRTRIFVLPAYAALWNGWEIQKGGKVFNLIDGFKSKEEVDIGFLHGHRSANMSPFVCRILDGKYVFDGKAYEFKNKHTDGSAIHGLVCTKPFETGAFEHTGDEVSASFHYKYRKDDPGYPFDYDITVKYSLNQEDRMTLETTVINRSEQKIPVQDGWHPYFSLGTKIDHIELQFLSDKILEFSDRLVPTGKKLPYREFNQGKRIGTIELDNAFLLEKNEIQPKCSLRNPETGISIQLYPEESYPVLQIYTPPHRNSIAIECLSGAPDGFNNGMGVTLLEPDASASFKVSYGFDVE